MITLVFSLHRRPDLSAEQFSAYWRDQHGPLVRSLADSLGIRRYEQLHPLDSDLAAALGAARESTERFDGVAEIWFENEDDIVAAASSPEGRRAAALLLEDERRFIDLPRSPIWLFRRDSVVSAPFPSA